MRITSPHCGAEPQSQSGGEVYEVELIQSLAAAGHDLHLILASHKQSSSGAGAVTIHRPYLRRGLRWWVTPFVWPWAIARCWRECGPFDLLRAHSVRYAGPSCLIARRVLRLQVPIVTHIHHLDPSPLNGTIERRVLNASDLVVTDSTFARGQLVDLGVTEAKIRVVNSGIADRFRPLPARAYGYRWDREYGWPRFVIAACGQLIPRKDPMWALRVMRHLKAYGYGDRIGLVWIGTGALLRGVEAAIREWGLGEMVRLPGHVTEDEKLDIYQRCDLFMHASTLEGFALAPQEAMACGKPVLGRKAASMGEMIEHGISGYLVNDERDAADTIEGLIRHPGMVELLGCNAQARAERLFRWSRTMAGVEAVYREACSPSHVKC